MEHSVVSKEIRMKQIRWVLFIVCIIVLGGCETKGTEVQSQRSIPFEAETTLFTYEGTKEIDAIAVDEEGYLLLRNHSSIHHGV